MIKKLFNNELFFPNLNPPIGIVFKDILKLIFRNGIRSLAGALIIGLLVLLPSTIFLRFSEPLSEEQDYGKIIAISIVIWSSLLGIYFLISTIYTIYKSWQWYISYLKNFGKGNYRKEYDTRINEINKNLRNKLLDEKLNKNSNFDFDEEYTNSEIDVFNQLKKRFVKEFLTKKKNISPTNIDSQISVIEKEFDEIIVRKLKSNMEKYG